MATPSFPNEYTLISDINNKIKTDLLNAYATAPDMVSKVKIFTDMYNYLIFKVPGYHSVYSNMKSIILNKLNEMITMLDTSYASDDNLKNYSKTLNRLRYYFNGNFVTIKFTWYENNIRCSVAKTKSNGYIEIRRGDITGMALKKAEPRTWASGDELMKYWKSNGITYNMIGTA
jgi:hypothetical protein